MSNKIMHRLIVVSVLLYSSVASAQGGWVKFGESANGDVYFDQTTIQPDQSRPLAYFAWWRAVLNTPASYDGKPWTSSVGLYRVDCVTRGLRRSQITFFSSSGAQVGSERAPTAETLPVPDTLGDEFVKAICARAGR